jgi:hypothetical protein
LIADRLRGGTEIAAPVAGTGTKHGKAHSPNNDPVIAATKADTVQFTRLMRPGVTGAIGLLSWK